MIHDEININYTQKISVLLIVYPKSECVLFCISFRSVLFFTVAVYVVIWGIPSNMYCTCITCFRYLLIENFIPPEEKNKIMNRLHFDCEEDQWRLQPVIPSERSVN